MYNENNYNDETNIVSLQYQVGDKIILDNKNQTYTIKDKISATQLGTIYLANYHESINVSKKLNNQTDLVLKTSSPNPDNRAISEECLKKEYTTLKDIKHKNIIECKHFFEHKDFSHLVLEYIEGKTLKSLLSNKQDGNSLPTTLTAQQAISSINQIGRAVQYLHEELPEDKRILHLDIKPLNIMSDGLNAKLIDFGTSEKIQDLSKKEYQRSNAFESGAYTAPEIKQGHVPDVTADVYSLTATLYFALTGSDPLFDRSDSYDSDEDDDNSEYLNRRREEISRQLDSLDLKKEVKEEVKAAILSGMALQPKERPQSVKEWLALLPKMNQKISKDQKWSFQADNGRTFYFKLDENNYPIKLGDGSYSIVYLGLTDEGEEVAIKVLYDKSFDRLGESERNELTKQRLEAEVKARDKINNNLPDNGTYTAGIIKTFGYTTNFKDKEKSPAYNENKSILERGGRKLSDYAAILTLFEMPLSVFYEKDNRYLVTFKGDSKQSKKIQNKIFFSYDAAIKEIYKKIESLEERKQIIDSLISISGHDHLTHLNIEGKIKNALSNLDDIIDGLLAMHNAGYYHLDLKLQNLFIRSYGNKFELVIGDLGWISYDPTNAEIYLEINQKELPLGTLGSKSHEQKDSKHFIF